LWELLPVDTVKLGRDEYEAEWPTKYLGGEEIPDQKGQKEDFSVASIHPKDWVM
jgi:hypothetical protein